MEQQQFKCSGDCLNCRKLPNERREQWQYCAAQFTYSTMRKVEDLFRDFTNMMGTVEELKEKIEAIQNNEAEIFNPSEEKSEIPILPTAQKGDGAEE